MNDPTRNPGMPWMSWIGGIAMGALAMYMADPSQGRRRRAWIQDQVAHLTHTAFRRVDKTLHRARNRWSGAHAGAMRLLAPRRTKPMDDHVLEARVRSRLGRSLPLRRDFEVRADRGRVTLTGRLSKGAQDTLLQQVMEIPGVESAVVCGVAGSAASRPAASGLWWLAGTASIGFALWSLRKRRQALASTSAPRQ